MKLTDLMENPMEQDPVQAAEAQLKAAQEGGRTMQAQMKAAQEGVRAAQQAVSAARQSKAQAGNQNVQAQQQVPGTAPTPMGAVNPAAPPVT